MEIRLKKTHGLLRAAAFLSKRRGSFSISNKQCGLSLCRLLGIISLLLFLSREVAGKGLHNGKALKKPSYDASAGPFEKQASAAHPSSSLYQCTSNTSSSDGGSRGGSPVCSMRRPIKPFRDSPPPYVTASQEAASAVSAADSSKGEGVVLRPPELSREEIQAEVLKLLHQHTASFVSDVYSVHIETRGSRQLAAYLKGYEAELGAQDFPPAASMMQQKAGSLAASVMSYTTTGAQVFLDNLCRDEYLTETKDIFVARVTDTSGVIRCFSEKEIDIAVKGPLCVDGCGNNILCYGTLLPDVLKKLKEDPSFAEQRELKYDAGPLRNVYCVSSLVQRELNTLCPNGQVARWNGDEWRCYSTASDFSFQAEKANCTDNCGMLIMCNGQPQSQTGTILADGFEKHMQLTDKHCPCDERMIGERYHGCQTQTHFGKTCQQWSSQSPHEHDVLTTENHNYCRNPSGEPYLWCFTTDPDMRFDTCNPVGLTQQYLQPQSRFSVAYHSHGATPYKALRFFDGSQPNAFCGSSSLVLASGVNLPLDDKGAIIEMPTSVVEEGDTQKLLWGEFWLSSSQKTSILACICDFEFATASLNLQGSCSNPEDFKLHAGFLTISGPLSSQQAEVVTYQTSTPVSLSIKGINLKVGDRLDIGSAIADGQCVLRSLGRTFSIARNFATQSKYPIKAVSAWLRAAFSSETTVTFSQVNRPPADFETGVTETFVVNRIAEYTVCWSGEGTEGRAVGMVTKFRTTGFDVSNHVATYSVSSSGANEGVFSLFGQYAGPALDFSKIAFALREISNSPCAGNELARSTRVTAVDAANKSLMLRGSGLIIRPRSGNLLSEGSSLHACVDTGTKTVFVGFAAVRGFGFCETRQVAADGEPAAVPLSTYELTLGPFSEFGFHWLSGESHLGAWKGSEAFFTEGNFFKTITFSLYGDKMVVYAWTADDILPVHVSTLTTRDWTSITTDITFERFVIFAVVNRTAAIHIAKFDTRDVEGLLDATPVATTAGISMKNPCCLVTVYGDIEAQESPSILALDSRNGRFLWFDEDLQLIDSRNNWQGLSRPLEYPCSMSCSARDKPTANSDSDDTDADADTDRASTKREPWGVYDCYIADRNAHRIIHLEVDAHKRGTVLVREIMSVGARGDMLQRPISVLAFKFKGEVLIFTLQEGRQALDLLVAASDGTVDRYSTMQGQSAGLGTPRLPFLVEVGEKSSGLDYARIVLYRHNVETFSMQMISLDATAVAPAFTYSHADWYTVGERVTLEPVMAGGSSISMFKSFTLNSNVPNFAYVSRVASVTNSGTLTLDFAPLTDPYVEIGVVGQGVVNSETATFSVRVACKNGHFMKDGMCAKCPVGTYNSLMLVRQSPIDRWGSCKKCRATTSTVAEGSAAEDQCVCARGYYFDPDSESDNCLPCPAGTWKDNAANSPCVGVQCPANSFSNVTGATSSEDRKCSCLPGYVYDSNLNSCILATQGTFAPGGYRNAPIPCPPNTTTSPDKTTPLTSLQDCMCDKGYEPADGKKLQDPTTSEFRLKLWLKSIPEYGTIEDSQICVPCGRRRFKASISAAACEDCPAASFANTYTPKSRQECKVCEPGFYEISNVDMACGQCPEGNFCVGSEPLNPNYQSFAGLSSPCPKNSGTVEGSGLRDHPFKCVCLPGYEVIENPSNSSLLSCRAVEVGRFKDLQSNVAGTPCPLGGSSEAAGADSVELCVCKPGEYRHENTYICTDCPMGFYCPGGLDSTTLQDSPKVPCPENMVTAKRGSSSVSDCVCDKGFFRVSSGPSETQQSCAKCYMNTYKDRVGEGACTPCDDNSGTQETGATSASQCLCNGGYYYNDSLKQCTACRDPVKYCPGGSVPCHSEPSCVGGSMPAPPVACPDNTLITAGFDTPSKADDCLCNRGFAFRGYDENGLKKCEPCPAGSFKSSVQDSNCNGLCGSHSTSFPGMLYSEQCFCEPGTYYATGGCYSCPEGAICDGGLTKEAIERLTRDAANTSITAADHIKPYPQQGYFLQKMKEELEDTGDWLFLKCPVEAACLEHGSCYETMDSYLCSECKEGFTNTFSKGSVCTECPPLTSNILLCLGYYICLLLFNIAMAYMNVAAGFNRRSIHAIVIKIATNFLTCMSVISAVDFEEIEAPSWFLNLKSDVQQQVFSSTKTHWMSVDCIMRSASNMSYGQSFFNTMLFIALLPIILPVIASLIMMLVVNRVKAYHRKATERKLLVLNQTIRFNLTGLTEQLRDKFEEDRLFMMFRYVPLPGETAWRRAIKFFEDMIPIYVTVLFFMYTSTTSSMLSLLDCTTIDFGNDYGSGSFLSVAMSIECKIHPKSEYFKFAMLGAIGSIVWSIGIPLGAFLALYINRKNLNSRENRLKYGFLHNGYVRKYWWWETVVFARKLCVLVVSSIVVSSNMGESMSRMVITTAMAIAFNILHLHTQPFDKRSYLTLDRLENHSMAIWTLSACLMVLILGAHFQGTVNVALMGLIAAAVLSFIFEVGISLVFAYFDNVRSTRSFFKVPVIGRLFQYFAYFSERRRSREPVVILDEDDESIQLVAPQRIGRLQRLFRIRNKSINFDERNYFLKVMAEALGFAVVHLRLDVIPGSFLEFALRLGLAFSKLEQDSQDNKASLQALEGGDMSKLVDWTRQEEARQLQKSQLLQRQTKLAVKVEENFFSRWEAKLIKIDDEEHSELSYYSSEDDKERLRDLEGGESDVGEEPDTEEDDLGNRLADLEALVSRMTAEEQAETMYLFDKEVIGCGIALSELYLSLLKLQLKSPMAIADQFEAFRSRREIALEERAAAVRFRNRKLIIIKNALKCAINTPQDSLEGLLPSEADFASTEKRLQTLQSKAEALTKYLEQLKTNPDCFDNLEADPFEWVEAKEARTETPETNRGTATDVNEDETEADEFQGRRLLASSGSDLSDAGSDQEKPPKKLRSKQYRILAADAPDWLEG